MATISLDVSQKNVITPVFMKQLDTGRTLTTFIYDNGVFKDLSGHNETDIQIKLKKPDGYYVYNEATTVNADGSVTFNMTEQMLAVAGMADAEVIIPAANETIVSTCKFKIFIEASAVSNSEIESSYEFSRLEEALESVSEATQVLEEIQSDITEMESSEALRISAENTRISSENSRVSAENTRQSQESTRQTNTATAISNCNTATANANQALENMAESMADCDAATVAALDVVADRVGISRTIKDETHAYPNVMVDELIDGIEVGGRNLLTNTSEDTEYDITLQNWGFEVQNIATVVIEGNTAHYVVPQQAGERIYNGFYSGLLSAFDFKVGECYTWSADVKGISLSSNASMRCFYTNTSNMSWQPMTGKSITLDADNYARVFYTFIIPQDFSTKLTLNLGLGTTAGSECYIKNLKLERGNKPTDWTPAPEDMASKADLNTKLAKTSVVNNQSTTEDGFALNAKQANSSIPNTLGAKIKALEDKFPVGVIKHFTNTNFRTFQITRTGAAQTFLIFGSMHEAQYLANTIIATWGSNVYVDNSASVFSATISGNIITVTMPSNYAILTIISSFDFTCSQ